MQQPLSRYLSVLNQLLGKTHAQLRVEVEKDALAVNGVRLVRAHRRQLLSLEGQKEGILLPTLNEDERQFCEKHRISYLTLDGHLQLIGRKTTFSIHPDKKPPRKKHGDTHHKDWQTPTLLISPNSLAILDVLFRVSNRELTGSSGLGFSKQFGLDQSKLSRIMQGLNAKDLVSLKAKIADLPDEWWQLAFQYPATKKGLTPFFEVAKPFHSAVTDSSFDIKNLILKSKGTLVSGPVEMAKSLGVINDHDKYLWGTDEALKNLKQVLRLVPGKSVDGPTWFLAIPCRGLQKEAVVSRHPGAQTIEQLPNPFRAIWDLSYGSERLKEVRLILLRKVIK